MLELYKEKKILQDSSLESILEEDDDASGENDECVLDEYLRSTDDGSDDEAIDKNQQCVRIDSAMLDFGSTRHESVQEKSIQVRLYHINMTFKL